MRGRGGRKGGSNPSNRTYESNGPDVKVRGTAAHIAEKYVQLARDAATSGDPVASENYLQHAEHYFRIVAATQPPEQRVSFALNNDADGDEDGEDTGAVHNNGHANGHAPGRGDQPSELTVSAGETEEEADASADNSGGEAPQPRRGRGRPRRQQSAQKSEAGADEGGSGEAEAPVIRADESQSEASLDA